MESLEGTENGDGEAAGAGSIGHSKDEGTFPDPAGAREFHTQEAAGFTVFSEHRLTVPAHTTDSLADKTGPQAAMFANRLCKRYRHLRKWARRSGCDAFRLYDRDIPEIPLVLDVYAVPGTDLAEAGDPERAGPFPVVRAGSGPFVVGAFYKRHSEQSEHTPAGEAAWLSAMSKAIGMVLAIPEENIFLKQRERRSGTNQYTKIDTRHVTVTAREKDTRFIVNLSDYLDTGLFLDARKVRSWLRDSCEGKRVLNLFCYTGSLSLVAAKGGASSVDSVDLSSTYLDWAQKNFALNGYGYSDPRYRFVRADVFRFIDRALNVGRRWDLIILDPPVFSNSKKMTGVFDVKRGHETLIKNALSLLAPNGILLFGVKLKRFSLEPRSFPAATVTDVTGLMKDEDCGAKNGGKWYVFKRTENAQKPRSATNS
jgi:23S rRNA G2069 N7-methylase RlmK/C1962 C5-methylase RlmI